MFTMNKFWEKFFYVLTWLLQGSSFLSPRTYGIMHRMHHAYADTEQDPHSPSFSNNLFDMMWKTKNFYNNILHKKVIIQAKFLKNIPNWNFIEKLGDLWIGRLIWGVLYTLFYIKYVPEGMWYLYLLLPIHFIMGPVHGMIINWFAHKFGYTNFKVNDTAKNLLPFDFLMLGESYHNNHHKLGGRANFGIRWFEFDPTYVFILLFNALGIIKLKKNNDLNYM
jgi:stearoyl-CoA desaturase (Delta-9 desaturase)